MPFRLTDKEFLDRALAKHGDKYDYSKTKYINAKTKICVIDKESGEFWITPDKHLYAGQGPITNAGKRVWETRGITTKEEFIKRANDKYNNLYDYSLVSFRTLKDKVKIICKIHGEFLQTGEQHLHKGGCRLCGIKVRGDKKRIKFNDFVSRANEIHNKKYIYNENSYVKVSDYTIIICKKHGDFQQVGTCHLDGDGCPKCRESRGEVRIEKYLLKNNIKHVTQFRINKQRRYRYDFYLEDYNLLIEYDGEQHFNSIEFWGGDDNLKKIQKTDENKNILAKENNFKLLRISYKNFNSIEQILEKEVYNGS